MYVANCGSDNVSVINASTNKVIQSINVGKDPVGVAFDGSNGNIYVTNGRSNSVSVLGYVKYAVTFTETGLPSGTIWYVNISNGIDSGAISGTSYSIYLANGSYSYNVQTSNKIYEPSYINSFTVNGNTVSHAITFFPVTFKVTFTETGLLTGSDWYVNITGHDSGAITGSTYSFSLTNGTYAYTIGTNNTNYNAIGNTITVNGISKSVLVTFTASSSPSKQSPSGISGIELYGIIGAAVAIVAIGSVLTIMRRKK